MADAMCTGESPPLIPANVCDEILNLVRTEGLDRVPGLAL